MENPTAPPTVAEIRVTLQLNGDMTANFSAEALGPTGKLTLAGMLDFARHALISGQAQVRPSLIAPPPGLNGNRLRTEA